MCVMGFSRAVTYLFKIWFIFFQQKGFVVFLGNIWRAQPFKSVFLLPHTKISCRKHRKFHQFFILSYIFYWLVGFYRKTFQSFLRVAKLKRLWRLFINRGLRLKRGKFENFLEEIRNLFPVLSVTKGLT